MDNLLKLAERCEAATGPDRELSTEIAEAIGYCLHRNKTRSGAQSDTGFDCDDCGADSWGNKSKNGLGQSLHGGTPHFTASLDAAMTLVPEDYWLELKGPRKYLNIPTPVPNYWSAHIALWNHEGDRMGWGATPSLALCAAALRARAAQPIPGEQPRRGDHHARL